jgi:hypothetical protein
MKIITSRSAKDADLCGRPQRRFAHRLCQPADRPKGPARIAAKPAKFRAARPTAAHTLVINRYSQHPTASLPPSNLHRPNRPQHRA